jgi:2-keto-4-pentenoate hydratase/2-oxohepta-3-ene-1,7-dioic acid hydratase in catechol pathway
MYEARYLDSAGNVRIGEYDDGFVWNDGDSFAVEDVYMLPPVVPSKIVCVGLNYAGHAEETGSKIPDRPLLFLKPPNTLASPNSEVKLLSGKDRIDYEAELAVIIGRQCRNVSAADVDDVIRGYSIMNDISNRDDQLIEQNWIRGKAFDNSAPLGPVVATPDEVPQDAEIELRLNGRVEQQAPLTDFIFEIPEIIEEITRYMTLERGDVISTGTPAGVGALSDGDKISISVDGIPPLNHSVRIAD